MTRALALLLAAGAAGLSGCSLMEPQEDPALIKATQVETRVAQVERQAQGMLDLQRQIQALQADLRRLRGELEQAQFELQSQRQQNRDLYADLDRRLQAVETRPVGAVAGTPGAASDADAYQAAFGRLRARDYAGAERAFTEFLAAYPNSPMVDNAKYWLGEVHYVERRYPEALSAFQRVYQEHPQSAKVPDALLKAGYAQYELRRFREARELLNRVVGTYGDSPAAGEARERLRRMDTEKR